MFISPMLLHKAEQPFDDDNFITELKLDGFRCIWTKFENKVKIYTRHNNEITSMFPELIKIDVPDGTVLDGEIIVTDSLGRPDFEAVMERFKSKKSSHSISFSVFDILYFKGKKITQLELLQRKEFLNEAIPGDSPLLNKVKWVIGNGTAYFDLIKQHDLEGTVFKAVNSRYSINKRSHDWLKVINYKYKTVSIAGIKKEKFGLILQFENGSYAGLMEFMPTPNRKEFYKQYRKLMIKETDKFIYIEPQIKMEVKYRNLTKNGLLRIPSFNGWAS